MSWRVDFYDDRLADEIHALPASFVARFIRYAERMEMHGPDLGMPHTRAMGDGLFELRLSAAEGIARVFYCTAIGKQIVMLHQLVKKTQKTPPKDLAIARRRMQEVKDDKHA